MSSSFVAGRGKEWRPPRKERTSKGPGIALKSPQSFFSLFSPSFLLFLEFVTVKAMPRMTPGGDEYHGSSGVMG